MELPLLFLGADHAGFEVKEKLRQWLESLGYFVIDCGAKEFVQDDDYPEKAFLVGLRVQQNPGSKGILVCGTGEGVCIAANKIEGIRAVSPSSGEGAALTRQHNDANVLCLGSRLFSYRALQDIVAEWLSTEFLSSQQRHVRRVSKILRYERSFRRNLLKRGEGRRHVIPALLEEDAQSAREKLSSLGWAPTWVQVDVMDGSLFSRKKTFDLEDFPWEEFPFLWEAHLMVSSPAKYLSRLAKKGFRRVYFQSEVHEQFPELFLRAREESLEVGIALSPQDSLALLKRFQGEIEAVLLMGVAPGKSGQEMLSGTVERLREAREMLPRSVLLGVDGGIHHENLEEILEAGAESVAVGSAIFSSQDPFQAFERLQKMQDDAKKG